MKKAEGSDTFSEVKHTHKNPVASLGYAHINKSIIYVAIHHPSTCCLPAKHPKHRKLSIVSDFFCHQTGRYVSTRKPFVYLGTSDI